MKNIVLILLCFCFVPSLFAENSGVYKEAGKDKDSLYKSAVAILDDLDAVPEDFPKAFKMLRKSCDLGNAEACARLGEEYICGFKIEKNETKALHYLEVGYKGKSAYASYYLYMYHFEKKNFEEAFSYLKETYQRNQQLAAYNLYDWYGFGKCYSCGIPDLVTEKYRNDDSAFYYLRIAACYDDPEAYMDLGIFYLKGYKTAIKQDSAMAACSFRQAIEWSWKIPAYFDGIEYYLERNIGKDWVKWLVRNKDVIDCYCY